MLHETHTTSRTRDTETGVEVVGDSPRERLGDEGSGEGAIDGQSGHDGQRQRRHDLNVLRQSLQGDGRQRLLLGEDFANIVVFGV